MREWKKKKKGLCLLPSLPLLLLRASRRLSPLAQLCLLPVQFCTLQPLFRRAILALSLSLARPDSLGDGGGGEPDERGQRVVARLILPARAHAHTCAPPVSAARTHSTSHSRRLPKVFQTLLLPLFRGAFSNSLSCRCVCVCVCVCVRACVRACVSEKRQ